MFFKLSHFWPVYTPNCEKHCREKGITHERYDLMAFWEAWKLAFLLRVLACTNRTKAQIHPSPPKKKTKKRKKLAGNEKLLNINITEVSTKLVGAVFPELRWVVSFLFCVSYSFFFLSEVYVCEIYYFGGRLGYCCCNARLYDTSSNTFLFPGS